MNKVKTFKYHTWTGAEKHLFALRVGSRVNVYRGCGNDSGCSGCLNAVRGSPEAKLNRRTLELVIDGRARRVGQYDVSYPSAKEVTVDCSTFPLSLAKKLLEMLS